MSRRKKDPRPAKALATMRNLQAAGWSSREQMIDGAALVLGDDEDAGRIAAAVYDQHFAVTRPN